jgi:hypothetical protein
MSESEEKFLSRWSRLKHETREAPPPEPPAPPAKAEEVAPPELPPVESLTKDSDYSVFFQPKVDEGVRRAALKKLFSDPHFNVMDGLDVYIDDYSKGEVLPAEMLAQLKSAQKILQWARNEPEEGEAAAQAADRPEPEAQAQAELPPPAESAATPDPDVASEPVASPRSDNT